MTQRRIYNIVEHWKLILLFIIIIFASLYVNHELDRPIDKGMDIYYSWVEGQRLLAGENPYSRILSGNMRENDKYSTYFPLFYELSFLSQRAGLLHIEDWIDFWRKIFVGFEIAIAALIFFYLAHRKHLIIAVFSALFWLFNRWTLYQIRVAYFDFIPIFFMVLSIWFFSRHRLFSLFLLSISLAFKQIAIFLVPLYIIWVLQDAKKDQIKKFVIALICIASVPLVTSLPFIFWDIEGFIRSIFFSVTRNAADHFGSPTLPVYMSWDDLPARLPMLFMFALVYFAAWQKKIKVFMSAFLVMLTFVEFNPVQFRQYLLWVVVFIPFLLVDNSPQDDVSVSLENG